MNICWTLRCCWAERKTESGIETAAVYRFEDPDLVMPNFSEGPESGIETAAVSRFENPDPAMSNFFEGKESGRDPAAVD